MNQNTFRAASLGGLACLAMLAGCVAAGPRRPAVVRVRPAVQVQAAIVIVDDYDYYPGYEVYYSRSRREYVYLEGSAWVRRPAPRGVTVDLLFASPSVRMDFRDPPEQHHTTVIRSYPRNWAPPGRGRENRDNDDKDNRRDDKRNDRKHDGRKD